MAVHTDPSSGLAFHVRKWLHAARRRLSTLGPPEVGRSTPIRYAPKLVAVVSVVSALAAVLAAVTVRRVDDVPTAVIGFIVIVGLAFYTVRWADVHSHWSSSNYVHIVLALTLGPAGAIVAATAEALGSTLRFRIGWFRAAFNLANGVVTNLAAVATYQGIAGRSSALGVHALAGLAAGIVHWTVNYVLLGAVVRASGGPSLRVVLRSALPYALYSAGYGVSAFGSVLLFGQARAFGLVSSLMPVVLLQGFLVVLSRQQAARAQETAAYQEERAALLQRAIDASDDERQRIARDLHDGVIQDLVGLSFGVANALRKKERLSVDVWNSLAEERFEEAGSVVRKVVAELRTLIIEIAPPKLEDAGLRAALDDLLSHSARSVASTELTLDDEPEMAAEQRRLVYRVAQEAVRNSLKYAGASKLTIGGQLVTSSVFVLEVTDNGRGFSPEERARRQNEGHVGLALLAGSCRALGGQLEVESAEGRGTTVRLNLPLAASETGGSAAA